MLGPILEFIFLLILGALCWFVGLVLSLSRGRIERVFGIVIHSVSSFAVMLCLFEIIYLVLSGGEPLNVSGFVRRLDDLHITDIVAWLGVATWIVALSINEGAKDPSRRALSVSISFLGSFLVTVGFWVKVTVVFFWIKGV